jgi:hypothetical protein
VARVPLPQRAYLARPLSAGLVGFVELYSESVLAGLGAHTDGMRPPDHDQGSVGVVRAAVVAKGPAAKLGTA